MLVVVVQLAKYILIVTIHKKILTKPIASPFHLIIKILKSVKTFDVIYIYKKNLY